MKRGTLLVLVGVAVLWVFANRATAEHSAGTLGENIRPLGGGGCSV